MIDRRVHPRRTILSRRIELYWGAIAIVFFLTAVLLWNC